MGIGDLRGSPISFGLRCLGHLGSFQVSFKGSFKVSFKVLLLWEFWEGFRVNPAP